MANKNISLDPEAYARLKRAQKPDESFSDTLKRILHGPESYKHWFAAMEADPLTDEAVEAIEQVIADRRAPRNRRPLRRSGNR